MPAPAASARRGNADEPAALHQVESAGGRGQARGCGPLSSAIGMGAMGQHASLPPEARPGRYLPDAMFALGRQSHRATARNWPRR